MTKSSKWMKAAWTVPVVLGLVGSTGVTVASAHAKAPQTVKVVIVGNYTENDSLNPVTGVKVQGLHVVEQKFDQENPGAQLKFIIIPWTNYVAKLQTMMTGGEADVYQDPGPEAQFAAQGLLQPLEPFIKQSGFKLNTYIPGQVDGWKVVGKGDKVPSLYGIPETGDTDLILYDKKIFQQWKVPVPSAHPTMAEILSKAKKITGKNPVTHKQNYGVYFDATGQGHEAFFLEDLAAAQGGTWGSGYTPQTMKLKFDSPQWIRGLDWMTKIFKYAPQGILSGQGAENWNTPNNNIGMYLFTGPGNIMITAQQNGFIKQLGITQVFKNRNGVGGFFAGSPYSIGKTSKNKELAWKFIEFSGSDYYQKFMYDNYGNTPVVRSAAKWPEMQKYKADWTAIFKALGSMETPVFPWETQPRFTLDTNIQAALSGKVSPAAALKKAEQQSNAWLAQQK